MARKCLRLCLVCAVVLALAALSIGGCAQKRVDSVVALLDRGQPAEALAQAEKLAADFGDDVAAKRSLSAALVHWADGRPVRPWPAGGLDYKDAAVTASVYLQAGRITPDMPEVYTGLGRLSEAVANGEPHDVMGISSRVVGIWQSCPDPERLIQSDSTVRAALVRFIRTGGSYDLMAKYMPDDVDTQFQAAVYALLNGKVADAGQYAGRVQALLGDLPEVRVLRGYVGDWPTVKVKMVVDVAVDVPSGPQPDVVSDLWPAAVSGDWLYYQREAESGRVIERVPLAGGKPEPLAEGVSQGFALSSDGGTMYYAPFVVDKTGPVIALDLTTLAQRNVTEVTGWISGLTISADGTELAFSGRDGLFTCDASGDNLRLLVPSRDLNRESIKMPLDPAWSADGRFLAYRLGYYESSGPVVVLDAQSGKAISQTDDQRFRPRWGPAAASCHLYYTFSECESDTSAVHLVTLQNGRITGDRVLVDGRVNALASGWSPNGRYILIQLRPTYVQGDVLPQLWIYDTRKMELLLPLRDRVRTAAWASDGTAYCITVDGRLIGFRIGD